ncbi:MAG: Asp-tRNA(Asn)/Glu-tRNA(Gln) amidotransferase subunit GatC [Chloroflexota bacterium]|nr:Asp-tRNA(Asn)/Glu-tRNA(Gln) amidotransferase subunit GatC [Chloroflexota bacterium]
MPVDRIAVEHVARLAHITLDDDEVRELTLQLSSIVDHVARLQELDTEGIEPTGFAVPSSNVMRDDEVTPSWPVEAVLANAPVRHDTVFEVQAVLD